MNKSKSNIYIYIFSAIFIVSLIVVVYLFIGQINLNVLGREVSDHNIGFNQFDRNLKGRELVSLINYAVDHNNKMKEKDSSDIVKVEVKITEDKTLGMDILIQSGLEEFTEILGDQNFKIIDKEYYANGKISLMKYELLSIDSINNEEGKISI